MANTTSDYEIRASLSSADTKPATAAADSFTGTLNTWLPLSAAQSWSISLDPSSADGSYLRSLTFQIRNKNTLEIVSTTSGEYLLQAVVADGFVSSTINGGTVAFVVQEFTNSSGTAKGFIRFTTGGAIQTGVTSSNATLDATKTLNPANSTWYQGIVDSSLYQIKATTANGQKPTGSHAAFVGTEGTWIDLNVNREWAVEVATLSIDGSYDIDLTFEIREKASQTVVATTSGTFRLDATVLDQDPEVTNTLTGDTAKIVIDRFTNTTDTATVTITFGTDGTISGTKTTTGGAVQGTGGEVFSGTWFDATASTTTTADSDGTTVDTGSGSGGYDTGGGAGDPFFDEK